MDKMRGAFGVGGRGGSAGLGPCCALIVEGNGGMAGLVRGIDGAGGGWHEGWVGEGWVGEGWGGEGWGGMGRDGELDWVASRETLGDGSGGALSLKAGESRWTPVRQESWVCSGIYVGGCYGGHCLDAVR